MPSANRGKWIFLIFASFLAFKASSVALASGAIILVTEENDELNADGDCSLREAIRAANLDQAVDACPAGNGRDEISVPAGIFLLSLPGSEEEEGMTGDLDIRADLTITGTGEGTTIIDANYLDRVFHIPDLGSLEPLPELIVVEISDVTIRNGLEQANGTHGGGGILNEYAWLTLRQVTLQNNTTTRIGGGLENAQFATLLEVNLFTNQASNLVATGKGGGIFNKGDLIIERSTLSGNTADATGGAIDNSNTATLQQVQVNANSAALGAGIHNDGILSVHDTYLFNNQAGEKGGGIYNFAGMLSVIGSTFQTNAALSQGGGIFTVGGQLTLANSTLSDNDASEGGGVYSDGPAQISSSTIAYNSSGVSHVNTFLQATFRNTMIVYSDGANCSGGGVFVSAAHNLDSGSTCGFDIQNADPFLAALADNDGSTLTHALQPGSAAIDAAESQDCSLTDQRGYYRLADGDGNGSTVCDIGAFEADSVPVQRIYLPLLVNSGVE